MTREKKQEFQSLGEILGSTDPREVLARLETAPERAFPVLVRRAVSFRERLYVADKECIPKGLSPQAYEAEVRRISNNYNV